MARTDQSFSSWNVSSLKYPNLFQTPLTFALRFYWVKVRNRDKYSHLKFCNQLMLATFPKKYLTRDVLKQSLGLKVWYDVDVGPFCCTASIFLSGWGKLFSMDQCLCNRGPCHFQLWNRANALHKVGERPFSNIHVIAWNNIKLSHTLNAINEAFSHEEAKLFSH